MWVHPIAALVTATQAGGGEIAASGGSRGCIEHDGGLRAGATLPASQKQGVAFLQN